MQELTWKHVTVIVTALITAMVVELAALFLGYDGYLLAGFLAIIGTVVGAPVGMVLERKRAGNP